MISTVKKWLFAGLLCLLLLPSGCRPEGIIPPGDMETLFAAFYMADASIETLNATSGTPTFRPDSLRVYQPIIEGHGYTEDAFRASLDYYLHRPSDMVKMFKHVRVRLEQEADRPVEQLDTEDAGEEEIDPEEADGAVTKHPRGIVKEGVEPELEREPGDLPEVKRVPDLVPKPEKKPDPKPSRKRKKMSKEDLKRLEEELK